MIHPDNKAVAILTDGSLMFQCPGCNLQHRIMPKDIPGPGPKWVVNSINPFDISPSVITKYSIEGSNGRDQICHIFIKKGQIQYLNDCTHKLAGQTVDMVEYEN